MSFPTGYVSASKVPEAVEPCPPGLNGLGCHFGSRTRSPRCCRLRNCGSLSKRAVGARGGRLSSGMPSGPRWRSSCPMSYANWRSGQLPDVLRELEIRAAEDSWRRLQEQRQAQDKSRHWERVMDQARHDFRQAQLAAVLREQLKNWRLGQELDAYLAAMEASIPGIVGERQQMAATEWLTWAREYRRSVDPLANPLAMLTVPEPTPEDLKPFLQGWNPYGPGK